MPIVASEIIEDSAQADGRRYIRERHTDDLGVSHDVTYLAELGTDEEAVMASRVAQIEEQLRQAEINANMAKYLNAELDTYTFFHSTADDSLLAIRELFKTATKWELLTLGWVINEKGLSDNKLKALFGVDDAGLVTLKAKLANIAARYEEALALVGQ